MVETKARRITENLEQKSVTHFRPVMTATRPEFEFPETQGKQDKRK